MIFCCLGDWRFRICLASLSRNALTSSTASVVGGNPSGHRTLLFNFERFEDAKQIRDFLSDSFLYHSWANRIRPVMTLLPSLIGAFIGGCVRSWWSPRSRLAIGRDASSSAGVLFNGVSGGVAVALLSSYGSFQGVFYGLSMWGVIVFSLVLGYCFSDVIDSVVFVVLNPPWKKRVRKR